MIIKSRFHNCKYGGAKLVINKNTNCNKQTFWQTIAEEINKLQGMYITAQDSGTTVENMDIIRKHCPYVLGTSIGDTIADPGYYTARGVYNCIKTLKRNTHPFIAFILKELALLVET